jgi:hypothetical protein
MKPCSLGRLWRLVSLLGRAHARRADTVPSLWFALVSVIVGSGLLGGCMPKGVNLIKTGTVSTHTEAPESLELSAAVYAEAGTLIVYGTARHRSLTEWPVGHVDVEVTEADGTLLSAQHVPYHLDPVRRAGMRQATFRATFPAVPPAGAVITLRHHPGA